MTSQPTVGPAASEPLAASQVRDRARAGVERARLAGVPSSHAVRLATLTAVWAYSVSQPILSFLRSNPEFLVLRDATRVDTIGFAVVLALGPPLVVLAYTSLAGLVSQWVGDVLYLVSLGAFLVPLAFQLTKPLEPSARVAVGAVVAMCLLAVALYVRVRAVRLFLAYSVVLPLAALLWFAYGVPATVDEARAANVQIPSHSPVVLLILDELPLSSLETRAGRIDGVRYPGFGRLARASTWYPNATSVDPYTGRAVPAILSGRLPREDALPTLRDHPDNLFTLLGGGYSFFVHEGPTRLCPENLCPRAEASRLERYDLLLEDVRAPYILKVLPDSVTGAGPGAIPADGTFLRAAQSAAGTFESYIDGFSADQPRRSLYYAHVVLPHFPWRYLPSGREYATPARSHVDESSPPWMVRTGLQRHLVQLQYTDALLGRFVRKLERVGLWDKALVVVVADHGATFRAHTHTRDVGSDHFAGVGSVPLFVKYPGQRHGAIDSRPARTIDELPTIADVLGARLPWKLDGTSLRAATPHRTEAAVLNHLGVWVHVPLAVAKRQNEQLVRRNAAWFGEGRDSLFAIGTNKGLLGTQMTGGPRSGSVRVRIADSASLADVRTSAESLPAYISGSVEEGRIAPATELAVAVNGRIRALTRCVSDDGKQRFGALVPEESFRNGFNLVEVYAVDDGGDTVQLVRLGANR